MLQYYKFIQTQQFKLIILMFIFIPTMINAQVTYSEHVAPIIYENCTKCHRTALYMIKLKKVKLILKKRII